MKRSFLDTYRREPSVFDLMSEFENIFGTPSLRSATPSASLWKPPVDVEENETAYLLSFDLPGVDKDQIKIDLNERRLTVSGSRVKENRLQDDTGKWHQYERSHGEFSRSFVLPEQVDVDKIEAHFNNGVLELVIPKTAQAQPRSISIGTGRSHFFDKLIGSRKSERKDEKH